MSFSLQGGQIRSVLVSHGFPADLATQLANILANGAQQMRRSGEQVTDSTRPGLRMVTPDSRKHQFSNLDFRAADPDYRVRRAQSSEQKQVPTQQPAVSSAPAPQETEANYHVVGGMYTEARGTGEAVQVNVRVSGPGRMPVLDPPSNALVGKSFRAESNSDDLRFFIQETDQELIWKAQLAARDDATAVTVITDLRWVENRGLQVTTKKLLVVKDDKNPLTYMIAAVPLTVVTDVRDEGDIVIDKEKAHVFQNDPLPSTTIPTGSCET